MNAKAWIGIALAGVLLFCALPLVAILSDTEPASACGPNPGGRSAQAAVREHVGAVGRWKSGQVDNAAIIVAVGQQRRVPARGWVIAVATAMTESSLTNHGDLGPRNDHDSLGLFQQRPSMGWGTPQQLMDPVYASTKFYNALLKVKKWETLPLTVAAQKVQRSGFPDRYAEYENDAEAVVAKVTGAASITELPGASLADCATTPTVVTSGGWTRPVDAGIVSGFRTSERPKHQGVDLGAKRYTVIRAASAGKVVWANCDDDTGNCNVDGSPTTPGCDLLTAPSDRSGSSGPALSKVEFWVDVRAQLMEGRVGLPRMGEVRATNSAVLPFVVVDEAGAEVQPVSVYLRELVLSDRSAATCRSYAVDLLRWWRLLGVLGVGWERATSGEVAVLVGWMRNAVNPQRRGSAGGVNVKTGKTRLAPGYAPTTINHALSVVHGFYGFHIFRGRGPVVNPVPVSPQRRAALAHRSPLDPVMHHGRAPLRQREPARTPRALPDALWDELFAAMGHDRDRSLLAFYVSSGARASELLGLGLEHIDWAGQRIWVVTKGTRLLEPVPASGQAFALLAAYLHQAGLPHDGGPVWRTLRGESRPLSYWALRRILQRANARLGTNWTAHDMRHTAAARMVADSNLTLPEVQTVLRHRHLSSTQVYLRVNVEELFDKLQEHFHRPRPASVTVAAGYDPADMQVVFGG